MRAILNTKTRDPSVLFMANLASTTIPSNFRAAPDGKARGAFEPWMGQSCGAGEAVLLRSLANATVTPTAPPASAGGDPTARTVLAVGSPPADAGGAVGVTVAFARERSRTASPAPHDCPIQGSKAPRAFPSGAARKLLGMVVLARLAMNRTDGSRVFVLSIALILSLSCPVWSAAPNHSRETVDGTAR